MAESKLNIRLRRQVLVNTGNFTNCIAEAELELEDVKPSEYSEKYDILTELLSYTLQLESVKALNQQLFMNGKEHEAIVKVYKEGKAEEVEKKISELSKKL